MTTSTTETNYPLENADKQVQGDVKLLQKGINLIIKSKRIYKTTEGRLSVCRKGCFWLKTFIISTTIALLCVVPGLLGLYSPVIGGFTTSPWIWGTICVVIALTEFVFFWVGIILVYLTSQQLGVKWRGLGIILSLIPIVNLVMFFIILHIATREIKEETAKLKLNAERKDQQICKTKYPLLLVHGVFFRDNKLFNYWGRIPEELIRNGATIFYGNQDSSSSVMDSGQKIAKCIKDIIAQTGCEKVNIIAHSKGGLDSRAAITCQGMAPYVASLTTISTPHRGCIFADYLIHELSDEEKNTLAEYCNSAATAFGDDKADFLTAVGDLTSSKCAVFNENVKDSPDVFYQSFGSILNKSSNAQLPFNWTHAFVKNFDGPNDGLVGSKSFVWGERFEMLTVRGSRGISHVDVIDLSRENIPDFDVREFYVGLVADLKKRGF